MAVAGEIKAVGEGLAGLFVVLVRSGELLVDAGELGGEAVLLGFEEVEGNGSGVVGRAREEAEGARGLSKDDREELRRLRAEVANMMALAAERQRKAGAKIRDLDASPAARHTAQQEADYCAA